MSYNITFTINLGSTKTGLTLTATIVDTTGATVSSTTSGFVEIPATGIYLWNGTIPTGHRGAVIFTGTGVVTAASINPEEFELESESVALSRYTNLTNLDTLHYNSLFNQGNTTFGFLGGMQSLLMSYIGPMSIETTSTLSLATDIDTNVDSILSIVTPLGTGTGAIQHTVTITDINTSLPLEGVYCYVTATPTYGDDAIASGVTDTLGKITFYLDAATYYLWVQRSDYMGSNPYTIVVA